MRQRERECLMRSAPVWAFSHLCNPTWALFFIFIAARGHAINCSGKGGRVSRGVMKGQTDHLYGVGRREIWGGGTGGIGCCVPFYYSHVPPPERPIFHLPDLRVGVGDLNL